MTAPSWQDHEIEPGPTAPPCAGCAAWAEGQLVMAGVLNRAHEERDRAKGWARRWKAVARRFAIYSAQNHEWGEQWQEFYRQKDALLAEVLTAYGEVTDQLTAERDAAILESNYLAYAMRCAIAQTPLLSRGEWAALQQTKE